MAVLLNNSFYRVELKWELEAEGGSNPGGKVVLVERKERGDKSQQFIRLPLSQWRKINALVEHESHKAG